jgi:hypothetical protein
VQQGCHRDDNVVMVVGSRRGEARRRWRGVSEGDGGCELSDSQRGSCVYEGDDEDELMMMKMR